MLFFYCVFGWLCYLAYGADPRCGGPMEVWSDCDAACQKTCADPNCLEPCSDGCVPGCVCDKDYVRTGTRDCIKPRQCDSTSMNCPGLNQVLDRCGANGCQNTCEQPFLNTFCDPFGCSFGCICEPGYLRDSSGNCIRPEDCVKCDDLNAHFSNTEATECQNTCTKPYLSNSCEPIRPEAGCVCNDGFLKSENGTCLPAESCAMCEDPNAFYSLTMATICQNTCEYPEFQSVCQPSGPIAGCVCKAGFIKNSEGLCVTLEQCSISVCGINEHLEPCAHNCPPETCDTIGKLYKCPEQPPPNCQTECRCNLNHLRDARGVCIPIQQCPPLDCLGTFEVYDPCPSSCPGDTCEDASSTIACPANPFQICRPRCRCMDGYSKMFIANVDVCVSNENCFKCTGDNEEYRDQGPSCEPSCNTLYSDQICVPQVQSRCFCKPGFIRDSFKKCIAFEECYKDICLPNEVRSCGSSCDSTCATLNTTCTIINKKCNNMCYCADGYARDDGGICIPVNDCPVTTGCNGDPHGNTRRCTNQCRRTCADLGKPVQPCTTYSTRPACLCDKGFVLDEIAGNCVRPELCYICRGANEIWTNNIDCTCDDLAKNTCKPLFDKKGTLSVGCRCKDGYVRNTHGECIQAGTCPRCGEKEQYLECAETCHTSCASLIMGRPCIAGCGEKGCYCNPGLVRNSDGKCIDPSECPHAFGK